MNKRFPLVTYALAAGFASALGLYQLIPVETITTKIGLVILIVGIISAGLCVPVMKQVIKADVNYRWGLLMTGTFAAAAALTFLFHLSLPQKELLLQNQKIIMTLNAHWDPAEPEQQPIEFLSLNNGYRGFAFDQFQFSANWEKQKDAIILTAPQTHGSISFAGKTGKQVSIFFKPGSATTELNVDWGDGSNEKVALQKNDDETTPRMISHDYGETVSRLEILNFLFNLLPVIFMIWILLSLYLLILILILRKRDRTFRALFIGFSIATVIIRFTNAYNFPLGFDEGTYARAAMRYADRIEAMKPAEIPQVEYNLEHPALIKLAFALPAVFDGREEFDRFQLNNINHSDLRREDYTIYTSRLTNGLVSLLTVQSLTVCVHPITGFLFMIHSMASEYGAQAKLEAFPMLFSFLAIWFFARFLSDYSLNSEKGYKKVLALSAFFLGLTAASKLVYCIVAFAMIAMILDYFCRKKLKGVKIFPVLMLFAVGSVAVFFIFNPSFWVNTPARLHGMLSYHQSYQDNARSIYPWWQPIIWMTRSVPLQSGIPGYTNPLTRDPAKFFFAADELIILFALLGSLRFIKQKTIYFYWFLSALIFLLAWGTKWQQYACVVTIPICIAATIGIQRLAIRIVQYSSK